MSHALLIAAICVPYFGLMIGLGCYVAGQVRQHDDTGPEQLPDLAPRDEKPDGMLAAA